MKLFNIVMEGMPNNTLYQDENEITLYATIDNPDGLEQNDGIEKHTDYIAKFEKDGCKARVRTVVINNDEETKINYLTLKIKDQEEVHDAIASSKEYTVKVDDDFVEAFKLIAEDPLVKTRYIFNSKQIEISYQIDGVDKTIEVENVRYEVDIFDKLENKCKIDIEIDNILKAMKEDNLDGKKVNITAKVSHLPFKPVNLFGDFDEDSGRKIKSFWNKVREL